MIRSQVPLWREDEFRRGAREMRGVAIGVGAWGLVTGVAMVKAGLSVPAALAMSLLVFAGSAQLAVLPLLAAGAPVWLVLATAACVNLRFVVLSTQWRAYFGDLPFSRRLRMAYFAADLNYVLFMRRFPVPADRSAQWAYFWGGVSLNWTSWQLMSIAGIVFATDVPPHWGLGFAGTLALIGLTCSLLADRASVLAALVAGGAAVATHGLPMKLNIVVAIAAAVAVGMLLDRPGAAPAGPAPDQT